MKTTKFTTSALALAAMLAAGAAEAAEITLSTAVTTLDGTTTAGQNNTYIASGEKGGVPTGVMQWYNGGLATVSSIGFAGTLTGIGNVEMYFRQGSYGVIESVALSGDFSGFSGELMICNAWNNSVIVSASGTGFANVEYLFPGLSRERNYPNNAGVAAVQRMYNDAGRGQDTLNLTGDATFAGMVGTSKGYKATGTGVISGGWNCNASEHITAATDGAVLTLAGAGTYAYFGSVGAAAKSVSIAKTGAGSQEFGGSANYLKNLAVSGGTMTLSGTTSVAGAATVASGATLAISGTTTLAGAATVASGATLAISGTTTLAGAATVAEGGTLDLNGATLTLSGNPVANSGTVKAGENTSIELSGLTPEIGEAGITYTVFSPAGTFEGTLTGANFTISGATISAATFDPATGKVTLADPADLVWNGTAASGEWNTTAENWLDGSSAATRFTIGDNAAFTSAAANKEVALANGAKIFAGNATVSDNYTFKSLGSDAANQAVISGNTLAIESGKTLTITETPLALNFSNIALSGKMDVRTNAKVPNINWPKLTFAGENAEAYFYDTGDTITFGEVALTGNGAITAKWGPNNAATLGQVTGEGALTLTKATDDDRMTYTVGGIGTGATVNVGSGSDAAKVTLSGSNAGTVNVKNLATLNTSPANVGAANVEAGGTINLGNLTTAGVTLSTISGDGKIQMNLLANNNSSKNINIKNMTGFTGEFELVGTTYAGTGVDLERSGTVYGENINEEIFGSAATLVLSKSMAIANKTSTIAVPIKVRGNNVFIWPNASATFTLNGTTTLEGSSVLRTGNGVVKFSDLETAANSTYNVASGTSEITGTANIAGTVNNSGTFKVSGTANITGAFNNSSTLTLEDGASVTSTGTMNLGVGSVQRPVNVGTGAKLKAATFTNAYGVKFVNNGIIEADTVFETKTGNSETATTFTGDGYIFAKKWLIGNVSQVTLSNNKMILGGGGLEKTSANTLTIASTMGGYEDWSSSAPMAIKGATFDTAKYTLEDTTVTCSDIEGQTITLSGVLSGTGKLTKTGAGTLKLTGNNTYSGGTTVSEGTLAVNAATSLGAGAVSVAAGATLDVGTASTMSGNLTTAAGATLLLRGASAEAAGLAFGGAASTLDAATVFDLPELAEGENLGIKLVSATGMSADGWSRANVKIAGKPLGTLSQVHFKVENDTLILDSYSSHILVWNGGDNGVWKVGGGGWLDNGVEATFTEGAAVRFPAEYADKTVTIEMENVLSNGIEVNGEYTFVSQAAAGSTIAEEFLIIGESGKVTLGESMTLDYGTKAAAAVITPERIAGSGTLKVVNATSKHEVTFDLSGVPEFTGTVDFAGNFCAGKNSSGQITKLGNATKLVLSRNGGVGTMWATVAEGESTPAIAQEVVFKSGYGIVTSVDFNGNVSNSAGTTLAASIGTVTLNGAENNFAGTLDIGGNPSVAASITFGANTATTVNNFKGFDHKDGGPESRISVEEGAVVNFPNNTILRYEGNGNTTVKVDGTMHFAGNLTLARDGKTTLNINDGALVTVGGTVSVAQDWVTTVAKPKGGIINLNEGGTLIAGGFTKGNGNLNYSSLNLNGGVLGTSGATMNSGLAVPVVLAEGTTSTIKTVKFVDGEFTETATTVTMDGRITGDGALVVEGAGTIKFGILSDTQSGNNSFTGGLTIRGAVAEFNYNTSLGTGVVTLEDGTVRGMKNYTYANTSDFVLVEGKSGTVDTQAYSMTFAGAISGKGAFKKVGTGTLTLPGENNTYTGGTTISAGMLASGNVDALGNGPVTLAAGATLNCTNAAEESGKFLTGTVFDIKGAVKKNGHLIAYTIKENDGLYLVSEKISDRIVVPFDGVDIHVTAGTTVGDMEIVSPNDADPTADPYDITEFVNFEIATGNLVKVGYLKEEVVRPNISSMKLPSSGVSFSIANPKPGLWYSVLVSPDDGFPAADTVETDRIQATNDGCALDIPVEYYPESVCVKYYKVKVEIDKKHANADANAGGAGASGAEEETPGAEGGDE